MTMLHAAVRLTWDPAVVEVESDGVRRCGIGAARHRALYRRFVDMEKRQDRGEANQERGAEGCPRSKRHEQETANSGAGKCRNRTKSLDQSDLAAPAVGIAERREEDVVTGAVEHLSERRDDNKRGEREPDPVNERKHRARERAQNAPENEGAPQPHCRRRDQDHGADDKSQSQDCGKGEKNLHRCQPDADEETRRRKYSPSMCPRRRAA